MFCVSSQRRWPGCCAQSVSCSAAPPCWTGRLQVRLPASFSRCCSALPLASLSQFSATPAEGSVGAWTRMAWSCTGPGRLGDPGAVRPGSCEVRSRRLLHASASSPPQCAADGSFLPVQCKFINTTDRTELDLLHAFSRSPQAFETFSSFRRFFPLVSSYCFCSDSRGRELEGTGDRTHQNRISICGSVRLLVRRSDGQPWSRPAFSFHSVKLEERSDLNSVSRGRSSGLADCPTQRRLALSQLFSGPIRPPAEFSSGASPASCLSLLRPVRDLVSVDVGPAFLYQLIEVLHGLFPSVSRALEALTRSTPRRLQENLFGGKFLKNAADFNFNGVVGTRGVLGLDQLSSQSISLQKNRDLVQAILTRVLSSCSEKEDDSPAFFIPRCTSSGRFQQVQCQDGECWCVDSQGHEVPGSRTAGRPPRCPSRCERERATAMKMKSNMAAGAEIHVPACSEEGDFLPLQCVGPRCFCVDAEGRMMAAGSTEGAVTCPENKTEKLQSSAGRCSKALAEVTAFRQEVEGIIILSNSSQFPVGYGFLLAKGLSLTPEELQMSQSEEKLKVSERLLSRSKSALRLAAFSSESVKRAAEMNLLMILT
ncbi:hypothetical protein GOODEAATRI_006221 [Goodea atripinnis]|uniref:Thyroglobulin type-1 domain-containing protein n=1 Tax=Goodea atripinnis TaxID=208336 RepID=A0ABV0N165_9TELE